MKLFLLLGQVLALSMKPKGFKNETLDSSVYKYEDISYKDIWDYKIVQKQGCIDINSTFWTQQILESEEPWFIVIYSPGSPNAEIERGTTFSTILMQSLYFLKRDLPKLNCGLINGHDEVLREMFENAGLP